MIGCVSAWWGLVSLGLVRQGRHGRASCGSSGCGVLCHRRFGRVRFRLVWLGWAGGVRYGKFCLVKARRGLVWQARCGLSSYGVSGCGQERFVGARQARRVPARFVAAR